MGKVIQECFSLGRRLKKTRRCLEATGWRLFAMRERGNEQVEKNVVAVVCTSSHCKEEVVDRVSKNISMIVSMFLIVLHCALDILATWKHVNRGGKYGLGIPENFHFYDPENATN